MWIATRPSVNVSITSKHRSRSTWGSISVASKRSTVGSVISWPSSACHDLLISYPAWYVNQIIAADPAKFDELRIAFNAVSHNPIEHIIATDGGYTEVVLERDFPSRLMHFLQIGALYFRSEDLAKIDNSNFIAPEDMAKLKNIERLKFAVPTCNMRLKNQSTLVFSVLEVIAEFFRSNNLGETTNLMDTLAWLLFRRYKAGARSVEECNWVLATNPHTGAQVTLSEAAMDQSTYTFACPDTGLPIRLTDVFRLHEIIDEETGATGILGYLTNVIEHIVIVHLIRGVLATKPQLLGSILFIKDGPCGFFGQTANLHKPMSDLVGWLQKKHNLFLVGLEKSGAFVEHAQEIKERLPNGSVLLLSNAYIYKYILPGQGTSDRPYGSTTNYGHKVIFKTRKGQMHVVSIPTDTLQLVPTESDLRNVHVLLTNVENLHCDMYDSALFPIALVNKLVSLAAHPSRIILQNFAKAAVG